MTRPFRGTSAGGGAVAAAQIDSVFESLGGGGSSFNADNELATLIKSVALNLIIELTEPPVPVDIGKLVSNWQATLNAPASVISAYDPGSKGSTRSANVAAAIEAARINIAGFSPVSDTIFISNNVDYLSFQTAYVATIPGIISSITREVEAFIETSISS